MANEFVARKGLIVHGSIHVSGSTGHVTASGNISASGNIYANKYLLKGNDLAQITTANGIANTISIGDSTTPNQLHLAGTNIFIAANTTSSGNISASKLLANDLTLVGLPDTSEDKSLMIDSDGVVSGRTLGSNAFTSTTIGTTTNSLTDGNGIADFTFNGSAGATVAVEASQTTITSILATDLVVGEDSQTKIDFETANEIHFDANNVEVMNITATGAGAKSVTIAGAITASGHISGSSLTVGGNISSSFTSTGSFGVVETPYGVNFTGDNSSNQGAKIFYTNASAKDKIVIQAGTRNMLEIHNPYTGTTGEVVVNEDSLLIDFRAESADESHMLYVDATNDAVGIGTSAPGEELEVVGNISASDTGIITGKTLIGIVGTATQETINHDTLANFVANEHIDHSSVSVAAGTGLTGGGTIVSNRTLNVIGGDGIDANADDISITPAQTTITSIYATDLAIGEDDETQIDFESNNEIHFDANGTEVMNISSRGDGGSSVTITGAITASGNISASSLTVSGLISSSKRIEGKSVRVSDLTPGRVAFIGTAGLLVDDSDLTFDGTATLTATNIAAFNLTGKLTAGSTEIEGSAFDINGGAIDGVDIATSDITVGSGKTLDVSEGTLTLAANQISGDKVEGGTINAITITTLTTAAINASTDIDIGTHDLKAATLTSDVATGTAPLTVTSTTEVSNLKSATATALATARAINTVDFDGTADITIAAAAGTLTGDTLKSTVVASSLTSVGTIATGVWNGDAIATAYIANDAIDADKIGDNVINSEHYAAASIDNEHLADNAVDTDEIANDAVTAAKLASNAVVNASIASNAAIAHSKLAALAATKVLVGNGSNVPTAVVLSGDVTMDNAGEVTIGATKIVNSMIGDGAVDTEELAADSVTAAKIGDNVINSEHYAAASIDNEHLADNAVDTDEIANNAVTLAKMAGIARGKIIVGDASGDPSVLAAGADGKILVADANGDPSWTTVSGDATLSAGALTLAAAQTNITSIKATDLFIGEDSQTGINFETTNEIHFDANNVEVMNITATGAGAKSVTITGAISASGHISASAITLSGNISSSLSSTGSFGILETPVGVNFTGDNHSDQGAKIFYDSSDGDKIIFQAGTRNMLEIQNPFEGSTGEVVINENNLDVNFRVESNGKDGMLYVDGGTNKVGIGTTSPGEDLEVIGNVSASGTVTADAFVGDITGTLTGTANVAIVANTVKITDNENANENNPIVFVAGADADGGNLALESDGTTTYNPSTGKITATGFVGILTGNVTGDVTGTADAADSVTNALTVDNATLQLNSGTTYDGSAAVTIAIKDGGVDTDALADSIEVGTLTATTINVLSLTVNSLTSSVVTSSIIKTEGSNIFGDNITDRHTFNGHITASGKITASFYHGSGLELDDGVNLDRKSDARGDILYRGASTYERLAKGNANTVLIMGDADPTWNTVGTGNITDNAVSLAKMANLASTKFILGNGSNNPTAVVMSGDATMDNAGEVTIEADAVTYAKIQNVTATNVVLGRDSSGAGIVEEIAAADLVTMLGIEPSATADQTKADIDGLAITTVGTIDSGTWQGTTIKTAYIADANITRAKIEADAIDATKIENDAVDTEHIADDAIEEEHIGAGEVKTAALANDAVDADKLAANAVVNASVAAGAAIAYTKLAALADANILVGNGSNVATVVAVSGDVSMANTGAVTIGNGKVLNAMLEDAAVDTEEIAASAVETAKINDAAVTYAKIQDVSATNRILGRDSSGAGAIEEITPANVLTMLGSTATANDFTDTLKNKLDAIEASATADQSKSDIDGLSITTVGTIDSGVWNGTKIADAFLSDNTLHLDTAQTILAVKTIGTNVKLEFRDENTFIHSNAENDLIIGGTDVKTVATNILLDAGTLIDLQQDTDVTGDLTVSGKLVMGSTDALTDAGLLSVANQSNITGVGTIGSGTWQGTTIKTAYIADANITMAKLDDVATNTIIGRTADNAGVPKAMSATEVRAILGVENNSTADQSNAEILTAIEDGVDSVHYKDASIDTEHIADGQITVDKMAANSVDSDQYVDASIDNAHLADNAVDTDEIAADAVTYVKMQNLGTGNRVLGATSAGVIGEVQVVTAMIANDAIEEEQIGDGEVKTAALANDAVNADKLAANSVVNASITAGAAIAHSKLAALAATKLLVGNGSNVPTAVVLSGDVSMNNAGAVTIGNGKILNAMLEDGAVDTEELAANAVETEKINNAAVTLEKQANLAADKIIGRANGAGTGVPTALTPTQVRAIIGVEASSTADQTKSDIEGLAIQTTGELTSGTIGAGFGAIDNGASGIRTNTFTAETAFVPDANDGATIGTTSLQFSDVFLAEGAVINFDDGDVTLTQTGNNLAIGGTKGTSFEGNITASGEISGSAIITRDIWIKPKGQGGGGVDNETNDDRDIRKPIRITDGAIKFYTGSSDNPKDAIYGTNRELARIRAVPGSFNIAMEISGAGGYTSSLYVSESGQIGFNTQEPTSDVDFRTNDFKIQNNEARKGIRVTKEGNLESFDKTAGSAATGSEFVLNYSRGVAITKAALALLGTEVDDDAGALEYFANLAGDEQAFIIEELERLGFNAPPNSGDTIGQVRWVIESGSSGDGGDFDQRVAGEAANIAVIVADTSPTGVTADMIFKISNQRNAPSQEVFRLKASGKSILTSSLSLSGDILLADNKKIASNTNSGNALKYNSSLAGWQILASTNVIAQFAPSGFIINENGNQATDFRVEGGTNEHLLFTDAGNDKVAIGTDTVGGALLTVAGGVTATAITSSGNIKSAGNVIANNIFLPGAGKISFDDSLDGTDQFIVGDDHSITIDGDDFIKLRADTSIRFQDNSGTIFASIDPNAGHVTASGNISASGNIIGTWAGIPITEDYIGADAITAAKIGDNVINSEHYAAASIDNEHLADNAVDTDEIAADAVTYVKMQNLGTANRVLGATSTGVIGEVQVVSAMIANDAVTLAKMAGLTRGSIIAGDASGDPAELTIGGNGTVLKSDGTDITWGTAGVTNALTVDNATLQLNSGTTYDGTAARTISIKNGGVDSDALAASIAVTTLTAASITVDSLTVTALTSSIITSSIQLNDGSNIFGDAIADTQTFNGNITASGNISASGNIIGTWAGIPIATAYIANDAIDADKIGDNVINSEHYAAASIDNEHLADNAVGTAEIAANAVTLAKMAGIARGKIIVGDSSGDPAVLAAGADGKLLVADANGDLSWTTVSGDLTLSAGAFTVGATKIVNSMIGDGAVDTEELAADSVTAAKIGNDVINSEHYAAASIDNEHLADNAVGTDEIADDAVTAAKLASNAVVNASIAAGAAIAHSKLAALAATKVLVGNGSNVAAEVALSGDVTMANNGAVTIAADAVSYAKMQNLGTANRVLGATSTGVIGETQVVTAMIANDAVTADHIGNDVLNSEHYAAASIDNEHLADDAVGADELAANAVVNASVAANAAIVFTKLENLDSAKMLVGNGSNKATEVTISGDVTIANNGAVTIGATKVVNGMLADGAVDTEELAADSVTAAKIGDNVINSEHYAAASIDNEHLADNAVNTDEIAANAVTLAKLAGIARGKFIVGDASGDPSALAAGANGKLLVADANGDPSWTTVSGDATLSAGALTLDAAQTNINSILATDLVLGEDAQTKIDFETVNEIHFDANNTQVMNITATGTGNRSVNITGAVTASGAISASGIIEGYLTPQVPKVEYYSVTASNLIADRVVTLPNSLTYKLSHGGYEYLEVFTDGIRLNRTIDYVEVATDQVRHLISVPSQSIITYKSLRVI